MTEKDTPLQLPVKPCLTLEVVKLIATKASALALQNHWKVSIAIVDDGANLLYLERLDGAQISSSEVAQGKARTAMRYQRASRLLEEAVVGGRTSLVAVEGITPLQGAVPLIYDGQIIGAIGVSGVLPTQDEQVAVAGADVLSAVAQK
jgi:glc operon protein GlcG